MGLPIFQVDAFTARRFAGNPAAVCLLPAARDALWMQNVAREMNLAETALLVPRPDGFDLRWFTPAVEVDLCGHATLASAHILFELGLVPVGEQAIFYTKSGVLKAGRQGDEIVLDFPATPAERTPAPPGLAEALGATPCYVGATRFDYLVEVDSEETVRGLKPDLVRLATFAQRGFIVTSRGAAGAEYDIVSRFFAPAIGIDEDPVTGSAHACLGPYWCPRLGKEELLAYQASARGGSLRVRVCGERVYLAGKAVTVLRGELVDG